MPLSFTVRFRYGRYDADARPGRAEWPPHPARLFRALVASAGTDGDWDALAWLERAGAPRMWAVPRDAVARSTSTGYVVANARGPWWQPVPAGPDEQVPVAGVNVAAG